LQLFLDLEPAGKSDDLNLTVNYASVATAVVEEIAGTPLNLIEALAMRISNRVLSDFQSIERIEVTVHKPNAPVGVKFSDISVKIARGR
jgi:dihydroneopterin aldolase